MRASWKVDLKWVFGLICVVSALIGGLLYSFASIASHDTATALFMGAVGGFASSRISDEQYAAIQAAAAQDPNTAVTLPGIASPLPGPAVAGHTKEEAVKLALQSVAETNYEQGSDAANAMLALNDEDGGQFNIGPLGILTRKNHDGAAKYARIFGAVALVGGALAVVFSSRFGRIGTPGILLIISTAPLALVWTFISSRVGSVSGEESVFVRGLAEGLRRSGVRQRRDLHSLRDCRRSNGGRCYCGTRRLAVCLALVEVAPGGRSGYGRISTFATGRGRSDDVARCPDRLTTSRQDYPTRQALSLTASGQGCTQRPAYLESGESSATNRTNITTPSA